MLHAYGWRDADGTWVRIGAAGVDLFFVISGFIMATITKKDAGQFLLDRVWRIYPLWLIAVLPWLFIYPPAWQGIVASLTLWPSYPEFTTPALPLGWTLSFEMLFYLAFALAIRTRAAVPLALFGLSLVLRLTTHQPLFDYLGNPMIFEFLLGVGVANLPRAERLGGWFLLAGFWLFMLSSLDVYTAREAISSSVLRAATWGTASACLVYGALCLEPRFASPRLDVLVLLGNASYSIYLFHMLAIRVLQLPWLVELVLAVALGLLAHGAIEKPMLHARRALRWRTRTQPQPA